MILEKKLIENVAVFLSDFIRFSFSGTNWFNNNQKFKNNLLILISIVFFWVFLRRGTQ